VQHSIALHTTHRNSGVGSAAPMGWPAGSSAAGLSAPCTRSSVSAGTCELQVVGWEREGWHVKAPRLAAELMN